MYHVTVVNLTNGSTEEKQDFPFGQWQQIGFWLDESGLNREGYRVTVTFTDEQD